MSLSTHTDNLQGDLDETHAVEKVGRDWRAAVVREVSKTKPWWAGRKPMARVEAAEFVLRRAQENPELSYEVLAREAMHELGEEKKLSASGVERLLKNCGVTRDASALADLEKKWMEGRVWMPPAWWKKLLVYNPALREQEHETSVPGERLCQGWYPVGKFGTYWFHVHVTVDMYGSFATGEVFCGTDTDLAVELLERHTLPTYAAVGIRIQEMETRSCRTYASDMSDHLYSGYLRLQGIKHVVRASYEEHNGYMLKFKQTLLPGILLKWRQAVPEGTRRGRRASMDTQVKRARSRLLEMREEFAQWLDNYNRTPQEGYRNDGKSPLEFWQEGLERSSKTVS